MFKKCGFVIHLPLAANFTQLEKMHERCPKYPQNSLFNKKNILRPFMFMTSLRLIISSIGLIVNVHWKLSLNTAEGIVQILNNANKDSR